MAFSFAVATPSQNSFFCLSTRHPTTDLTNRNRSLYIRLTEPNKNYISCLKIHAPLSQNGSKIRRIDKFFMSSLSQGQENTQLQLDLSDTEEKVSPLTESENPQSEEAGATEVDKEYAECVRQILRVLEVLKENRDMSFNEVRLTIMIEDPREAEMKRQLAQEGREVVTREDLADALLDVYEGRMPSDRTVLRELAKEMVNWPKLEMEVEKKTSPTLSPYAQVTDTGVDPSVAAQRAKMDWDAAAEINPEDMEADEAPPPVVGFSFLYLVTLLPIIIGIAVIIILFVNSLQ